MSCQISMDGKKGQQKLAELKSQRDNSHTGYTGQNAKRQIEKLPIHSLTHNRKNYCEFKFPVNEEKTIYINKLNVI